MLGGLSLKLNLMYHRPHRVMVSVLCSLALSRWIQESSLMCGVQIAVVLVRKVVTTDTNRWGDVCEARSVNVVYFSNTKTLFLFLWGIMCC